MENLASMIAVRLSAGAILPCIKVLHAIDVASREYTAPFQYQITYSYLSGGVQVATDPFVVPLATSTLHAVLEPSWVDIDGPPNALTLPPDAGTAFTVTVRLYIVDQTGALIPSGIADTSTLMPSPPR